MLTLLACFLCGLIAGAILGWLPTLRWLRTEAPDDLTVAYLMGREDERKVQTGKKPEMEIRDIDPVRLRQYIQGRS